MKPIMNAFIWGSYDIDINVYSILCSIIFPFFLPMWQYFAIFVWNACNFYIKLSFLLLINFRVLKHKQFEENVTTTENSVKDTSNQCSNITTESSSTAVVVALVILLGTSVSALLITCVFIYCKGLGRCKLLGYGK